MTPDVVRLDCGPKSNVTTSKGKAGLVEIGSHVHHDHAPTLMQIAGPPLGRALSHGRGRREA